MTYVWVTDGPKLNFDTHGDGAGISYHGRGKGSESRSEGTLTAAFDGPGLASGPRWPRSCCGKGRPRGRYLARPPIQASKPTTTKPVAIKAAPMSTALAPVRSQPSLAKSRNG